MDYTYKTKGTCSTEIRFSLDGNIVSNITFVGGCSGNLQGLSRMAEGMPIDDVVERLENIRCGSKATSCPDQLAKALKTAKTKITV